MKNTRGNHKGEHKRNTQTNKNDHTSARSMNTKDSNGTQSTKDDTRVAGLLHEEVLMSFSKRRS